MGPERGGRASEVLVLSPEQDLLVRAAAPPGTHVHPVPTNRASVRWEQIVRMAEWHRLSALLWRYLHHEGRDLSAPSGVLGDLRRVAAATTVRNLIRQEELDRVLAALAEVGIPAMLLKGTALIETVYPNIGMRPMADIDILVPRGAVKNAHGAVEALGYAVWGVKLGRHDDSHLSRHHHHYPLVRQGVTVELHHHITAGRPEFDIAGFWERAGPGAGQVVHLLPAPEDLLLHVAIHFAADRVARLDCGLGQLADLAWIAAHWAIRWDALVQRAHDYGLADRLFLALMAGAVLLGGPAPPEVLAALQPSSYRPALGVQFVRRCVLPARAAVPLDRLTMGRTSAFPGRLGLEAYIGPDEAAPPSVARLRFRHAQATGRRLAASAASPPALVADLRLGWWVRSLRG